MFECRPLLNGRIVVVAVTLLSACECWGYIFFLWLPVSFICVTSANTSDWMQFRIENRIYKSGILAFWTNLTTLSDFRPPDYRPFRLHKSRAETMVTASSALHRQMAVTNCNTLGNGEFCDRVDIAKIVSVIHTLSNAHVFYSLVIHWLETDKLQTKRQNDQDNRVTGVRYKNESKILASLAMFEMSMICINTCAKKKLISYDIARKCIWYFCEC